MAYSLSQTPSSSSESTDCKQTSNKAIRQLREQRASSNVWRENGSSARKLQFGADLEEQSARLGCLLESARLLVIILHLLRVEQHQQDESIGPCGRRREARSARTACSPSPPHTSLFSHRRWSATRLGTSLQSAAPRTRPHHTRGPRQRLSRAQHAGRGVRCPIQSRWVRRGRSQVCSVFCTTWDLWRGMDHDSEMACLS